MKLIAATSANKLKVERLIELTTFVGGKTHSKYNLTTWLYNPPETLQFLTGFLDSRASTSHATLRAVELIEKTHVGVLREGGGVTIRRLGSTACLRRVSTPALF